MDTVQEEYRQKYSATKKTPTSVKTQPSYSINHTFSKNYFPLAIQEGLNYLWQTRTHELNAFHDLNTVMKDLDARLQIKHLQ
jgi:hypothetical protein